MSEAIEKTLGYERRMRMRSKIVQWIRSYFDGHHFLEVDTPIAISVPIPEAAIETFGFYDGEQYKYLQPSPEVSMKPLLSRGLGDMYQIAPVFRSERSTQRHRTEFRMLEWYRVGARYEHLMQDCENLFEHARAMLDTQFGFRACASLRTPFPRITVEEAFQRYAHFSILEHLERDTLIQTFKKNQIHYADNDSWDDLFYRIYVSSVEPGLCRDFDAFFLVDYPVALAALSCRSARDERIAERVEWFVHGLELANGFTELCDVHEQANRFDDERRLRAERGLQAYPPCDHFLQHLEHMPPSAGMALGLERLLMVLLNASDIESVLF